jgi:hypothetical protein
MSVPVIFFQPEHPVAMILIFSAQFVVYDSPNQLIRRGLRREQTWPDEKAEGSDHCDVHPAATSAAELNSLVCQGTLSA